MRSDATHRAGASTILACLMLTTAPLMGCSGSPEVEAVTWGGIKSLFQ